MVFVKHYWEEVEKTTTESYQNLTEQEYSLLQQDDELEVVEHQENVTITEQPDPFTGDIVQVEEVFHDVTFARTSMEGKVTIENVPPEEFLINRGAKTLEDARFICHRSHKSKKRTAPDGI